MYAVTLRQGFWDYSPGISKKNDAVVRFLLYTLNIVLSSTLDKNSPSSFPRMTQKTCQSWVQLTKIWWETGQTHTVSALHNALSDKKPPSIRLVLSLWTFIRLLSTGDNGYRVCTTWFFKARGKRRRAYIEGPRRRSVSEHDDNSSNNDSDDFAAEEDGAIRDMQNEDLGFLFASHRTSSGRIVKKWRVCFSRNFFKM